MEQTLMVLTVVATALILLSASAYDWKYREIPDWHWSLLFIIAAIISVVVTVKESIGPSGALMTVCIGLIAFDCAYDRYSSIVFDILLYASIAATACLAFYLIGGAVARTFVSIPIMYAAMTILYYTGILKGGADAKSIIAISAVFPTYPELFGMPLIPVPEGTVPSVFVPGFAVLTMALVISMLYVMYNIVRNIIRGDTTFPQMFMGTRMPLEKARASMVWPMEDVVDNEVVEIATANEEEDIWTKLENHGVHEIWVTAIIPFLIPITIAFFLMVTIGFPLFIL